MEILLRMRYLSMIILYKKTRNKRFWAKVFSPSSLNNKHNLCCSGKRRFARRKKHLLLSHVSRTCLALRVCLALALRLPRTCLRSPCKTLKMQANCYPPPPPKGQPLILLQASFLRWKITSITNKLVYFLLEPLFGSYTILPHGSLLVKKNWARTRLDATHHSFFSVHGQLNTAWTILYPKLFLHMSVSSQVIKQVYQTTQIKGTFLKKLRCCVDKIIRLSTWLIA